MKHTFAKTLYCLRALLLAASIAVLSGCGEPVEPVEQVRQRHDDTMGHPVKIAYEVGDDWVTGKHGRYTRADIPVDDASLYVDVESALIKRDDFATRLAELKQALTIAESASGLPHKS